MPHLRPCAHCARHVRADETTCPFCKGALAIDDRPAALPRARLGRAARMAFGAASITLAACGSSDGTTTVPPGDANSDAVSGDTKADSSSSETTDATSGDTQVADSDDGATSDTGSGISDTIAKPYGAPPADGWLHFV